MRPLRYLIFALAMTPFVASSQACLSDRWTAGATRILWRLSIREKILYLESAASTPGGLLLVGRMQDSAENRDRRQGITVARMLTEGDSALKPLQVPAGSFSFVQPRLARLSGGRTLMVWGEPLPRTGNEWTRHALWSAVYGPTGWNQVQRIDLGDRTTEWHHARRALVSAGDGRVHLLIEPFGAAGPPGVMHLSTDGNEWSRSSIPLGRLPGATYLSATEAGGKLHVAFVSVPERRGPGRNALYTMVQRAGNEWTLPHLLYHREPSEAHTVAATSTADGVVHVLWGQGEGISRDELFHASTSNGGVDWGAPRSVRIATTLERLPLSLLPLSHGGVLALAAASVDEDLQVIPFCPSGQNPPVVVMRGMIRYGASLLVHGANGSPVLLTSGILVSGERADAVWQLTTLTSRTP